MTLKHLFIPAFLLASATLWYCQKLPQPEMDASIKSSQIGTDREELMCSIPDPDPVCGAQIRARCINVAPGYEMYQWEVSGRFFTLENGQTLQFEINHIGNIWGGYQLGIWYDIPNPLVKQHLLDTYCPTNVGNQLDCIVYTDSPGHITQWSMLVDIKSGNRITSYHMNGATGILTPVNIVFLDPAIVYDQTDVDFLPDCSNIGAQGVQCDPVIGCSECASAIPDDEF